MKYLKSYNNYEPLNEGWKENLLAGLLTLVGSYAYGQQQDPSKIVRKAKTEKQVQNLIDLGYTLDSTSVDTVWKELITKAPDSEVISIRYTLDKDQYFESGKFTLNDNMKLGIDSIIKEIIEDGGIITNVDIESSTDKQPVDEKEVDKLKVTYYLSKEKEPVKIVKIKHKGIKVKKMGTVRKTGSTPPLKCWN